MTLVILQMQRTGNSIHLVLVAMGPTRVGVLVRVDLMEVMQVESIGPRIVKINIVMGKEVSMIMRIRAGGLKHGKT